MGRYLFLFIYFFTKGTLVVVIDKNKGFVISLSKFDIKFKFLLGVCCSCTGKTPPTTAVVEKLHQSKPIKKCIVSCVT